MKIYDLDIGDRFRLAGDDNSPIFIFDYLDGIHAYCLTELEVGAHKVVRLLGVTPILRIKE